MQKIPTAFERVFNGHTITKVLPNFHCGICKDAVENGRATLKLDGTCCMIKDGKIYKRFDYKPGRKLPQGAIPCQDMADAITGHFPHWVECSANNPSDKYHIKALDDYRKNHFWHSGDTFELIGEHINRNPYNMKGEILVQHGTIELNVKRDFESIFTFLSENYIEGIVFWRDGEPVCKIKRSDFGLSWGRENGKTIL